MFVNIIESKLTRTMLKKSSTRWLFVFVEAKHTLFRQDISPGRTGGPHRGEGVRVSRRRLSCGSAVCLEVGARRACWGSRRGWGPAGRAYLSEYLPVLVTSV